MKQIRFGIMAFFLVVIGLMTSATSFPSGYGPGSTPHISQTFSNLGWDGWFAIAVFILTFASLIREWLPPDITMLVSSSVFVITGILTPTQFLDGFSNDIIMTIAMLCVVVRALEINGVLEVVARRLLSTSKWYFLRMMSLVYPVGVGSAFLNNTPIVLLMTPIVRRWATESGMHASKFLIPLSYATILGGICTVIGTSTNIIVYGLLRKTENVDTLGFFELSYIGLPLFLLGSIYLIFVSYYLLPDRVDISQKLSEEVQEFTAEFIVSEDCPLIGNKIRESAKYFRSDILIQVERNNVLIDSPSPDFTILQDDRLIFAGGVNQIGELHTVEGLRSAADPHFKLDVGSSHFSEIVIPTTSLLVGKTLRRINFRTHYGASVFAVYRQGRRVLGNVADIILQPGDTLMLISAESWPPQRFYSKDFYLIRPPEKLAIFHPWRATWLISLLIAMVTAATMGVPIMIAALTAGLLMIFSGNISLREAQGSIMWNILLLIATSFAFAKGIEKTGVAATVAELILSLVGTNPYLLIGGMFIVANLGTEFLTNNAAALVFFPIAIKMATLAGYDSPEALKAVAVTVAVGCSCSFAIPTGYQTNMIVYGYGGYRFTDFIKVGLPLNVMVFIVSTLLIPYVWPLGHGS